MSVSIITTCKSRLCHLKQTLGSWKDLSPDEIIVVDVSCPDGTKDWLANSHPDVRCVSVISDGFNLAQARNVGASNAKSDYLFFVDADIFLGSGLKDWFEKKLQAHCYYKRAQDTPFEGIHEQGTFLCSKSAFEKIEGYDETFSGYGGEDHDIYYKLQRVGTRRIQFPKEYIISLDHSDEKRVEHYAEKNKLRQSIINRSYAAFKQGLLEINPRVAELPLATRQSIWSRVEKNMPKDFNNMEVDLPSLTITNQRWLPEPYYIELETQVSIRIKRRNQ